jgi:type II secretion system protein G
MIRNEKGFTLIELMVVVLIIGILVAIAVPVFVNASNNAKTQSCKANLRTLDGAIQTYGADAQEEPIADLGDLVPTYIKALPTCPVDASMDYVLVGDGDVTAFAAEMDCGSIEQTVNHAVQ